MTKELNDTSLYCMEFLKNNTVCILRSHIKLYYIPHEDDEHTQAGTYQSTHILTVCLVVVVITLVALLIVIFFLVYKKKQRDPQPLPAEAAHYSVVYDHWIRQRHCQ
ncbi:uncharacterized protein LOC131844042 [Achroia grisella]|uniref:uncharacterized protein LOC131844042 n=1 Tax=Achroia grisella TaxID=688607 RepID=UPI0027D25FC4|nr:uncharacterized protein LOC131844042 [Achroia grisella]